MSASAAPPSASKTDKLNAILALLEKQGREIEKLKTENKKILETMNVIHRDTEKMGKHIDFINRAYDKIAQSYLFKNIFN